MAGHSKWANIKHKKAAQDAKRGKIFTRLIKEITVASRMGGGDIDSNPRLRLAVDKAFEQNMPKDNVERAIKRGSGDLEGVNYEEIRYEGYGTAGAAVMVDCMTDNKMRTVADVRHAFSKHGGNLGTDGSVAFMFKHCGQLLYAPGTNEEELMDAALEAGAEDVESGEDGHVIWCADTDLNEVSTALETELGESESTKLVWRPTTTTALDLEGMQKLMKLMDALEDDDDIQRVTANFEADDEVLAQL